MWWFNILNLFSRPRIRILKNRRTLDPEPKNCSILQSFSLSQAQVLRASDSWREHSSCAPRNHPPPSRCLASTPPPSAWRGATCRPAWPRSRSPATGSASGSRTRTSRWPTTPSSTSATSWRPLSPTWPRASPTFFACSPSHRAARARCPRPPGSSRWVTRSGWTRRPRWLPGDSFRWWSRCWCRYCSGG